MSLLKLVYICWVRENIQHYMVDIPDYNNISIGKYKQEILQIFMLALHVYVKNLLTILYMEVIANIQC